MPERSANPAHRTVVTIGNFEAVHAGHIDLMRTARSIADERSLSVVAITFDPHPVSILKGTAPRPCLQSIDRRVELLKQAGADQVVVIEPTAEILALSPEQFIRGIAEDHAPACIIEGDDFHFGKARAGTPEVLRQLGERHNFDVRIVDKVDIDLSDQSIVRASSTMTRWLIEQGRVHDASRLLTRPHQLSGTVVPGDQRGRTIGFPTANLDTPCLLPADGVYAGIAILPDGQSQPAAIHVGPRATFNDTRRTVEAHLIDWTPPNPDNPHEYNWHIRLDLHHHLRGQAKFEGVDALVEQIERDCQLTLERLNQPAAHRAPAAGATA